MRDKYKYYEVFELENGWLLKINYPANPLETSQEISHRSYYCKDVEGLLEKLNKLIKNKGE